MTPADVADRVTLAAMAAGVVMLAVLLRRSRREDVAHGTLHICACVVGIVAYFAISEHRTATEVLGGGSVMIGHYVFWAVSESLTVLAVAIVGLPPLKNLSEHRLRMSVLGGLVGAGVLWVACGMFQALSRTATERWVWFAFAVALQAVMLWLLWWPVFQQGRIKGGEHLHDFRRIATAMTILWPLYLVSWVLGVPGLHVWAENGDHISFAALDIVTNIGIGVVNVMSINRLAAESDAEAGETSIAWSARKAG